LDLITSIASYRHTQGEAAALLQVSKPTFERFLAEHEEAKQAWKDGKQMCDASVRRLLFLHAKCDPATARFLAKNHLKMTDDGEPRLEAEIGKAVLSVAEAKARITEMQAKLAAPSSRALVRRG
jgi:hypothetical protein